jgi:superfamily II DNA or RNA helicase
VLILDESHHFRNHEAKQSKGALDVARDIPYVFELTATPVKKEADDLYMQFKILDPDKFTSYWQFVNTYLWVSSPNGYGTKVHGVRRPQALKDVLRLYGIGRTYKEVDLQLPKLLSKKILVSLDPTSAKVYEMVRRYWRDQEKTYNNYMAALQALRRLTACQPKFDAVQGIVDDADGPVVVFCWYHETARKLSEMLDCPMITGNMPQTERPIVAKGGTHIVATISSLSEGVDLSHSHNVVFVEEDYTPGSRVQALARVRRWSASNADDPTRVLCHYVMADKTVDLTVHNAVEGRVHSLDQIMESEYLKDGEETTIGALV